jgi:putative transposase
VFVTIKGRRHYLWRRVDQDGDTLDILLQSRGNQRAAERFFRKLLKGEGACPRQLVTDKLSSNAAARRTTMPSVPHVTARRANNRAEGCHQPTRGRERQIRGFKSSGQAQRFLAVRAVAENLFRLGRQLVRAAHYRELRLRAFSTWKDATCAY